MENKVMHTENKTVSLVLGSGGDGHEMNAPMALAIIGGLVSSTILTLLVVPVI